MEPACTEKCLYARRRRVLEFGIQVLEINRGVLVDRPTLGDPRRVDAHHNRIAVRVEQGAVEDQAKVAPHVARPEVELRRVPAAILRTDVDRTARRRRGHDVDDTPHGVVAVEARARAVHDLYAVRASKRHACPVHPSAERVVEGHAVEKHERAAHAAGADAAERHALRRRVRGQAAGPAEEAEGRYLAKQIVGHQRRRTPDVFLREHVHARGHVAQPLLRPGRGDGDRLGKPRRLQHHVNPLGPA